MESKLNNKLNNNKMKILFLSDKRITLLTTDFFV